MKIRIFVIAFTLFLFILPIPGTIAVRNLLMFLLLGLLASLWRPCRFADKFSGNGVRSLFWSGGLLTAWLIFQAGFISDEPSWAFGEIFRQWIPAMLSIFLGVGLVFVALDQRITRQAILGGLMLIFLVQTLFSLVVTAPEFFAIGSFPQGKTILTAGKLEISYWNNLVLAFLAVDALSRWLYRERLSALPLAVLVFGVFLVLGSNLAFGARNGMIGSLLLVFSLALLVLWHERRRISGKKAVGFGVFAVCLAVFLTWGNYQMDKRWQSFGESARVAWEGKSDVWRNPVGATYPTLESGEPIDASAYTRIAWIKAGVDLIADYPLGVGYGRNAFGHALRKTGPSTLGHAHSGLIDWAVGAGLPGLVLWVGLLGWLAWFGLCQYLAGRDSAGLVLTFVIGGFAGRMLLDSINRDHMLMLFFFVVAVLVALPKEPLPE